MSTARLAVRLLCLCTLPIAASAGESWSYYFFKDPMPLPLDAGRVAVYQPDADANAAAALPAGLHDARPSEVAGWSIAETPAALRSSADLAALIDDIAAGPDAPFVSPVFRGPNQELMYLTPIVLAQFSSEADSVEVEAVLASAGLEIVERDYASLPGAYKLRATARDGFAVLATANALAQRDDVVFCEPDMIFNGRGALIPNDPSFSTCWHLNNTGQSGGTADMDIDAPEAWDLSQGSSLVKVMLFDVGVQLNHPDLNVTTGRDFTGVLNGGGAPVLNCDNHGTPVAGVVSGRINNALGGVGVAPLCPIASARVMISTANCDDTWTSTASWTVDALTWGEQNGVRVTVNSNEYPFSSSAIATKYASTRAGGMVHFASTGNDGTSQIRYPASLPDVNAVGALDRNGVVWSLSNFGSGLAFCAPGVRIYCTDRTGADGYIAGGSPAGDYLIADGTSLSTPVAAGVAALILSVNPSLTAAQVETLMQQTATDRGAPGFDIFYGWGLPNARSALDSIQTLIRFVRAGATGNGSGNSWQDAYTSLTTALNEANPGDEIWVAAGTYKPSTSSRFTSFPLKAGLRIFGGFAGNEDAADQRDPAANVTILSGDIAGNDTPSGGNMGENSFNLFVGSNLTAPAIIDGFTLRGGNADGQTGVPYNSGAALNVVNGSVQVRNCDFVRNRSIGDGGAILITNGDLTVVDCDFISNSGAYGGGISHGAPPGSLKNLLAANCRFLGNSAIINGGGILHRSATSAKLMNVIFCGNSAGRGGGIYVNSVADVDVLNCSFVANRATQFESGGGVGLAQASLSEFLNSIFWANTDNNGSGTGQGAQVRVFPSPDTFADFAFCTLQGWDGNYGGTSNNGANPQLVDAAGDDGIFGTLDDDVRLSPGSPCIDSGNNGIVPSDIGDVDGDGDTAERLPIDLDGRPRTIDDEDTPDTGIGPAPIVDRGAYEYELVINFDCRADLSLDGSINLDDLSILFACWGVPPCGDINEDGRTDLGDLAVMFANWNAICP